MYFAGKCQKWKLLWQRAVALSDNKLVGILYPHRWRAWKTAAIKSKYGYVESGDRHWQAHECQLELWLKCMVSVHRTGDVIMELCSIVPQDTIATVTKDSSMLFMTGVLADPDKHMSL